MVPEVVVGFEVVGMPQYFLSSGGKNEFMIAEKMSTDPKFCRPARKFSFSHFHFIEHTANTFFYRQLDFLSEPGVANEILENEPKSCLAVS